LPVSSTYERAGFGPIAAEMITVDAPGPVRVDLTAIPYRRFKAPYWPKVEQP
jgi:microcystin degradation protein MlrC